MMPELKRCDEDFQKKEKAVRKAVGELDAAARACVRQAARDLARACRTVRDPDATTLGRLLLENDENFENVRDACHLFTVPRRARIDSSQPKPMDMLVFAALSLEDAASGLLSGDLDELLQVHANTVRSRGSSAEVLSVLRHRA
jgi:hypothetical protein